MRKVRIRRIEVADFRKNPLQIFSAILKKDPSLREMRKNDAILLRSRSGTQLALCFPSLFVEGRRGSKKVAHVQKFMIQGFSTFSALMISELGLSLGYKFEGLKTFDDIVARLLKRAFPDISKKEIDGAIRRHLKLVS